MSQLALDTFEIAALALQYHEFDPSEQRTKAERDALARTEKLIQLYLMRTAIDRRYTNQQQADALGVSLATVKRMAAGEEFEKVAAFMAPPTRSPMVEEGQAYVQDVLLPLALKQAQALLEDPEVRPSTKVNLIKEVLKVAFAQGGAESEEVHRRDAMTFLKDQGLQINAGQIVINQQLMPADYLEKLHGALPEVVDAEVAELDA